MPKQTWNISWMHMFIGETGGYGGRFEEIRVTSALVKVLEKVMQAT